MPSRIVVQPNGLYARFSTVVDNFTHYNLTRLEAVDLMRAEGRENPAGAVERAEKSPERFTEALASIKFYHGAIAAEAAKNRLTPPPS